MNRTATGDVRAQTPKRTATEAPASGESRADVESGAHLPRYLRDRSPAKSASACGCEGGCARCGKSSIRLAEATSSEEAVADSVARSRLWGGPQAALGTAPATESGSALNPASAMRIERLVQSGGETMPSEVRASLSSRLGFALGDVRVHHGAEADAAARSIGAATFSFGKHVAFARGAYEPGTLPGQALLAHELSHVARTPPSSRVVHRSLQTYVTAMNQKPDPDWTLAARHLNGESPAIIRSMLKLLDRSHRAKLHAAGRSSLTGCSNICRLTEADYLALNPSAKPTDYSKCAAAPVEVISAPALDPAEHENTAQAQSDYVKRLSQGTAAPYPGVTLSWNLVTAKHFTIKAKFELRGKSATATAADTIRKSIATLWNVKVGDVDVKCEVSVSVPPQGSAAGASSVAVPDAGAPVAADAAVINLVDTAGFRSSINKSGPGYPQNRSIELATSDVDSWTPAHEFGHFIGLADQYKDDAAGNSIPNPGWKGEIMAGTGGVLKKGTIHNLVKWWANWAPKKP